MRFLSFPPLRLLIFLLSSGDILIASYSIATPRTNDTMSSWQTLHNDATCCFLAPQLPSLRSNQTRAEHHCSAHALIRSRETHDVHTHLALQLQVLLEKPSFPASPIWARKHFSHFLATLKTAQFQTTQICTFSIALARSTTKAFLSNGQNVQHHLPSHSIGPKISEGAAQIAGSSSFQSSIG